MPGKRKINWKKFGGSIGSQTRDLPACASTNYVTACPEIIRRISNNNSLRMRGPTHIAGMMALISDIAMAIWNSARVLACFDAKCGHRPAASRNSFCVVTLWAEPRLSTCHHYCDCTRNVTEGMSLVDRSRFSFQ
jgi:hypothetical protein